MIKHAVHPAKKASAPFHDPHLSSSEPMEKTGWLLAVLLCPAFVFAQEKPAATPTPTAEVSAKATELRDSKLKIKLYDAGNVATGIADLVIREGIGYQFLSDNPDEVLIIDWRRGTITILHLERRIKTIVNASTLDQYLTILHDQSSEQVETQSKSKSRSERVTAELSRPLIDPNFKQTFDPKAAEVKLSNPSVEIVGKGVVESDTTRRDAYASCLIAASKLGAMRDPTLIPPFTRIEALRIVMAEHGLRPTELSFVYRLAGPPKKLRWTYQLIETLTDKEIEAIGRIRKIVRLTPEVSFDDYDNEAETK